MDSYSVFVLDGNTNATIVIINRSVTDAAQNSSCVVFLEEASEQRCDANVASSCLNIRENSRKEEEFKKTEYESILNSMCCPTTETSKMTIYQRK